MAGKAVAVLSLRGASVRGTAMLAAAIVAVVVLAGCSTGAPEPGPTASRTVTPSPTPTPTADPELVPGGTAGQNRPLFEFVLRGLLQSEQRPTSLAILDALTAAGFDRATIEITPDTTRVGQAADSILVGIPIQGQCLLGQIIGGELVSELSDLLGTGRCLVGRTASLD